MLTLTLWLAFSALFYAPLNELAHRIRYRKVGGLHFYSLGRWQLSLCRKRDA